jgi:hypothetical protein
MEVIMHVVLLSCLCPEVVEGGFGLVELGPERGRLLLRRHQRHRQVLVLELRATTTSSTATRGVTSVLLLRRRLAVSCRPYLCV